jgi:hypothetical protein
METGSRDITKKKYLAFLEELFLTEVFAPQEMATRHMVSKRVTGVLQDRSIIKRVNGGWTWNFSEPTKELVESVCKQINGEMYKYYKKNPQKAHKKRIVYENIAPIKRLNISDQQAIDALKNSSSYRYEIYRYEKKQIC